MTGKMGPPPSADVVRALKMAAEFIRNGIELGYIRMPEMQADPAHLTLPLIEDTLATLAAPAAAPAAAPMRGSDVLRIFQPLPQAEADALRQALDAPAAATTVSKIAEDRAERLEFERAVRRYGSPMKAIAAALEAYHQAAPSSAPDGWKLVPTTPTEDMLQAGVAAGINAYPEPWAPAAWGAMLAAAPQAPSSAQAGGDDRRTRQVIEGLLSEWDKLTRYGSPIAKAANARVAAARAYLTSPGGAAAEGAE